MAPPPESPESFSPHEGRPGGDPRGSGDRAVDPVPGAPAAPLRRDEELSALTCMLLEQEHRLVSILRNVFVERPKWPRGDPRRRAVWKSALWLAVFSGWGVRLLTVLLVVGVIVPILVAPDTFAPARAWSQDLRGGGREVVELAFVRSRRVATRGLDEGGYTIFESIGSPVAALSRSLEEEAAKYAASYRVTANVPTDEPWDLVLLTRTVEGEVASRVGLRRSSPGPADPSGDGLPSGATLLELACVSYASSKAKVLEARWWAPLSWMARGEDRLNVRTAVSVDSIWTDRDGFIQRAVDDLAPFVRAGVLRSESLTADPASCDGIVAAGAETASESESESDKPGARDGPGRYLLLRPSAGGAPSLAQLTITVTEEDPAQARQWMLRMLSRLDAESADPS